MKKVHKKQLEQEILNFLKRVKWKFEITDIEKLVFSREDTLDKSQLGRYFFQIELTATNSLQFLSLYRLKLIEEALGVDTGVVQSNNDLITVCLTTDIFG